MPMSKKIAIYAAAAVFSIIVNIGSQYGVVQLFGDGTLAVYASIFIGTGAGLVSKYLLDKFLVFEEKLEHGRAMVSQFAFYTFTGVFTTIVFWGTEIFFHYAFESDLMRYVGGVIGLVIGYILKFLLDSRFVFRKAA